MPPSTVRKRTAKASDFKHPIATNVPSGKGAVDLRESDAYSLSLKSAFRLFLIVRCASALYNMISDCDETFNYWEPMHYLLEGYGLQTWEYSPEFRIRSWAYILIYSTLGFFVSLITSTKVQVFYLTRLLLATICSFCEARFYRAIVNEVNPHVGRYVLVILLFSAGMYHASVAFLPSTFSMYSTMMAFSYILAPPSQMSRSRTYLSVFWLVLGGLAWPFSGAIGIPFVVEEIFVLGQDRSVNQVGQLQVAIKSQHWRLRRALRLLEAVVIISLCLGGCMYLVDSYFYGVSTFVPWNIVKYNVFQGAEGRGPDLFGTEPWYFYFINGVLNFNVAFVLAFASGLILVVTAIVDRKRIPGVTRADTAWPYFLMSLKLAPFYIWFFIFTLQPHKEERFLYIAYPLLALNAGISIYLVRSLMNHTARALGANMTTRVYAFRYTSVVVLFVYVLLSISRILVLLTRYSAPLSVYAALWKERQDPVIHTNTIQENYDDQTSQKELQLCVGKEWYRYQSSFLLPNDVRLQFIRSSFDGLLPNKFPEDWTVKSYTSDSKQVLYRSRKYDLFTGVRYQNPGANDLNRPDETAVSANVSNCDYIIDSYFPSQETSVVEPAYVQDTKVWERLFCNPFLDASASPPLTRAFWFPGDMGLVWGEYCLLKRKEKSK
ncbi:hypothetical protein DM01DRAFT_1385425 [Hesseltinella vesiculosa]|uniref:Mannosyltransferase n=1 Tax=Hesseltinella vesiculosa TaxID=101127 RepID=A0A1X2GA88_9FUNG|nr:hypothetical protein DM01DRAFT_1385425 [Hesseltinella vesiculosa]